MKTIGVALALVALFSLTAVAGELPKGTVELTTTGSFSHSSYSFDGNGTGSETDLGLAGGVGYSLTDRIALSGGLVFQHESADPEGLESLSASAYGAEGGLRYNFRTNSSIVPFVGGSMGILAWSGDGYDDATTTLLLPSVGGGMRYLIGNSASINFTGNWVHQMNALGAEDLNSNDIRFGIGLSVFPGGLAMQ